MHTVKWPQALQFNSNDSTQHSFAYCQMVLAQSAGAVEYTDCFSADGKDHPNECLVYDTKQSNVEVPLKPEILGMRSTPSLPWFPYLLWFGVIALDRVLSMGQIELCILMLNGIAWNRTVLKFKLRTYAKLNCLKWNSFCMLNWIV